MDRRSGRPRQIRFEHSLSCFASATSPPTQRRHGLRSIRYWFSIRLPPNDQTESRTMPQPRRPKKQAESVDYGWVISFGCKSASKLRRLKVDTDPASDTRPIEVPCVCGETHRVTVSPYRRRRSADEPFDLEVASLDELR